MSYDTKIDLEATSCRNAAHVLKVVCDCMSHHSIIETAIFDDAKYLLFMPEPVDEAVGINDLDRSYSSGELLSMKFVDTLDHKNTFFVMLWIDGKNTVKTIDIESFEMHIPLEDYEQMNANETLEFCQRLSGVIMCMTKKLKVDSIESSESISGSVFYSRCDNI
jgi:hypothetical protein